MGVLEVDLSLRRMLYVQFLREGLFLQVDFERYSMSKNV